MDTIGSLNMACFLQVCSHEVHPLHAYGVIKVLIIVITTISGTLYILLTEVKQIHIHVDTHTPTCIIPIFHVRKPRLSKVKNLTKPREY